MPPKLISKDTAYISPLQKITKPKRFRVSKACEGCRKRKIKCDGLSPCVNCKNFQQECVFKDGTPSIPHANTTARSAASTSPSDEPSSEYTERKQEKIDPMSAYKAIVEKIYPGLELDTEADLSEFLDKIPSNDPSVLQQARQPKQQQQPFSYLPPSGSQHEAIKISLPPKEIALKLIFKTWNEACILFRFYHRPIFLQHFNSLYETSPDQYTVLQMRFLPLIYSVIACGSLFAQGDNAIDNKYLKDEGYKYFIAARKLIDLTNSNNLENIQTIFMLTIFLQCSAKISVCYSYIGIALRSALRLNYHKHNPDDDYITSECKKRLFWTVYKFEIYINSMLNLPNCNLDIDDIEIGLPLDIDDINITSNQLMPQNPQDKLSSCGVNNHHTKLLLIMSKIFKKLYNNNSQTIELVPKEVITNFENELKIWNYELHPQLQYNNPHISKDYEKANKLIYLDYLHVKIMLYRPFITFLKPSTINLRNFRITNGLRCFELSKEIIKSANCNIDWINGSYWFSIYTVFFALTCLIYYFLEINNKDPETNYFIGLGKRLLMDLRKSSNTAERIYNLLNTMFENYNKSLKLTFSYESAGQDSESSVKLQQQEDFKKKRELEQKLAQAQALKGSYSQMNLQLLINTNNTSSSSSGIAQDGGVGGRTNSFNDQSFGDVQPSNQQPEPQTNAQFDPLSATSSNNNSNNSTGTLLRNNNNNMSSHQNTNPPVPVTDPYRLISEEPMSSSTSSGGPITQFESFLPNFLQDSYELDSNTGYSANSVGSSGSDLNLGENGFDEVEMIDWERIFANNEINLQDV